MARNTAMPSGYDYEFVEEVLEDYICIICQLAMRNPVQTRNCGHLYCRACLDEALKRKPNECPSDRRRLAPQDILPHPFAERKILSLKIKCPHQGCDWQGELRDIESHESRCYYKVVDCDNESCRVRKPRGEMVKHVQEECQYRMVPCPHCNNTYTFCLLEQHTSECPKCPVSCPNDCGNTMKREEVESHVTDECPLTIVPCSYQNIGCSFEVQRKYVNDHTTSQVEQHLAIAVEKIVSLQKQMDDNEKAATLTNQRILKQMDDNEKAATLTNERNLKQMDEMCKRFQIQMDEMKKQTNELIQNRIQEMKNNPIVNLMTDNGKGCFSYIWELKNVRDGFPNVSFYTHKNGYKLQLGWNNEHNLLWLNILPGEYDNILTWPLQVRNVTFTQLSQSSQQKNIEITADQFGISKVSRDVEKTKTYKRIASSFFLRFEEFQTDYAVNNTTFLKLEIVIDSLSVKDIQ